LGEKANQPGNENKETIGLQEEELKKEWIHAFLK